MTPEIGQSLGRTVNQKRIGRFDEHRRFYTTTMMCELLSVSRSGLNAARGREPSKRSRDDAQLVEQIRGRQRKHRELGRTSRCRAHELPFLLGVAATRRQPHATRAGASAADVPQSVSGWRSGRRRRRTSAPLVHEVGVQLMSAGHGCNRCARHVACGEHLGLEFGIVPTTRSPSGVRCGQGGLKGDGVSYSR